MYVNINEMHVSIWSHMDAHALRTTAPGLLKL